MPNLANKLLGDLNQTGLAQSNNQLYGFLKKLLAEITGGSLVGSSIVVYNVDTRSAAVSIPLVTAIRPGAFYVIKDIYGNAAVNNITLVGTVDGVVDPVMNTDYEIMRVYGTTNGYMSW